MNPKKQAEQSLPIHAPPEAPLAATLDLWRREARFDVCETGRYRCRFFTWGQGPPIVFIHGLADRAQSFVPTIAALRGEFTCLAYELPNGDDGAALGRYRHTDLVADLHAILDRVGWRQAYLMGSSFGATVALSAMADTPSRFPRAVLQGGFAQRFLSVPERLLSQWLRYSRRDLAAVPFRRRLQNRMEFAERAIFTRLGRDDYWRFLGANSGAVAAKAAARRALMLERIDLRPFLSSVRQPIMLVSGDGDTLVHSACEQALLDGLPNAARIVIPECGHYPQYTHVALFAEIMRQFLTAPSCAITPEAACPASRE